MVQDLVTRARARIKELDHMFRKVMQKVEGTKWSDRTVFSLGSFAVEGRTYTMLGVNVTRTGEPPLQGVALVQQRIENGSVCEVDLNPNRPEHAEAILEAAPEALRRLNCRYEDLTGAVRSLRRPDSPIGSRRGLDAYKTRVQYHGYDIDR